MRVAPPQQTRSHHEIGHKPGRLNSASGNDCLDCGRPAERLYRLPGRVLGLFHILRKPPAQLVLRLETEAVLEKIRNGRVRDLQDLVEKGAIIRRGELRYTRYFLGVDPVIRSLNA